MTPASILTDWYRKHKEVNIPGCDPALGKPRDLPSKLSHVSNGEGWREHGLTQEKASHPEKPSQWSQPPDAIQSLLLAYAHGEPPTLPWTLTSRITFAQAACPCLNGGAQAGVAGDITRPASLLGPRATGDRALSPLCPRRPALIAVCS